MNETSKVETYKNSDKRLGYDIIEYRNFWKFIGCHWNFSGMLKDQSIIPEILPWYESNAYVHYLKPYGLEQFSCAVWGTRDVSQGPMDFDRYSDIRASDSHGNIYWYMIALSKYIKVTGDLDILNEMLPYFSF